MYGLFKTSQFKKNYKKVNLKGDNEALFITVVSNLLNGIKLNEELLDHQLTGNMKDYRECHLKPDLLLIYSIKSGDLNLVAIGSHSELFI